MQVNFYHTIPTFNDLWKEALENAVRKGENAGNQHFLLFPQRFLLNQREKSSLQQHLICRLLSIGTYPTNLLFGKELKKLQHEFFFNIKELEVNFSNISILYHTVMIFDAPKEKAFRKHCGRRRKCWLPAFSPFSIMFSIP